MLQSEVTVSLKQLRQCVVSIAISKVHMFKTKAIPNLSSSFPKSSFTTKQANIQGTALFIIFFIVALQQEAIVYIVIVFYVLSLSTTIQ